MSRGGAVLDLGVLDLEEQGALLRLVIKLLRHAVSRPPDFNGFAHRHFSFVWLRLRGRFSCLSRCPLCQVLLMPLPLSVCKIVALVVVKGQTQSAFVAS